MQHQRAGARLTDARIDSGMDSSQGSRAKHNGSDPSPPFCSHIRHSIWALAPEGPDPYFDEFFMCYSWLVLTRRQIMVSQLGWGLSA